MLQIDKLAVSYGVVPAIIDVSLSLPTGSVTCIVGPNGAGKSTLLLAIAGALKPKSGSIVLDGHSIAGQPAEEVARLGCSLVPEGRQIFANLTIAENMYLGQMIGQSKNRTADLDRVMSYFPVLRARYRQPAGTLSGGEQQQLSIARSLLTRPKLLMIDEPSLGLAPKIVDFAYGVLRQLRGEGLTLLIVEQQTTRVANMAGSVHVLRQGHIVFSQDGDALNGQGHDQLEAAYFGYVS